MTPFYILKYYLAVFIYSHVIKQINYKKGKFYLVYILSLKFSSSMDFYCLRVLSVEVGNFFKSIFL